ncbi:MAG TPA: TlpA disulfide reductase family protein [Ginsengibacter sp.]
MRKLFWLTFICLFYLPLFAQKTQVNQFILKGKILNAKSPVIYLMYDIKENRIKDSCELKEGNFYFKGNINEPTWAILRGNSKIMDDAENPNIVDFFLDPTRMTATAKYDLFKEIKITGSKTQLEYEMLQKQYDAIDKNSDSLYEKFSNVNQKFIINNPGSYVSAFELSLYKTRWPMDSVKSIYTKLTPSIQNSFYGKEVKETIDEIENNSAGRKAIEFKTTDINGKEMSLSDFKGKYVLLDFWGSWCIPCRQSMPHLIALFKKYHKSGLEIIGVAEEYDNTGLPWRAAVKKDGTYIWYNVLSASQTDAEPKIKDSSTIVKKFGVQVFPTKILIDKTGVIIGRYRGTDDEAILDKKLNELFRTKSKK